MTLLKQKNFFLLMVAKLISLIGTQMQNFALSLYILKATGSATKFASVLALTLIPQLIFAPVAGVLVDWFNRKKILIYLDLLSGIIVGTFAVIYKFNNELLLGHVYFIAITLSLISLLYSPAISTVIPTIVKKEELVKANSMNSFIMNIGNLISPAIAGALLGFYGMFLILVVNSISFIFSSICELFITIPAVNKKPKKINLNAFTTDFVEGINFIKTKTIMLNIIILGLMINFVSPVIGSIGLTYLSKQVLKISDYQFGTLQSITVVALILSPLLCNLVSKKAKLGTILFIDIFVVSILVCMMAALASPAYLKLFSSNLIPYITLIIIGFIIMLVTSIGNMALGVMFQQEVPLAIMGRVGTVMTTACMAAVPLGQMIFGVLFDKLYTWVCFSIAASILLIVILCFRSSLCKHEKPTDELNTCDANKIHDDNLCIDCPEVANLIDDSQIE